MIPASVLAKMATLGLSAEQAEAVASMLSEVEAATQAPFVTAREASKEKNRARWREWKVRQKSGAGKREQTFANASKRPTRAEDSSSKNQIPGQEEKEDTAPMARSKRGERIPDDFRPDIDAAIAEGLPRPEAERQARSFCDYWRAKPGKDGLKLDWPATWRVWFRRNIPSQPHPQRQSMAPPQRRERSVADVFSEIAAGTWTGPQGSDHEPDQPFIETSFSRRN